MNRIFVLAVMALLGIGGVNGAVGVAYAADQAAMARAEIAIKDRKVVGSNVARVTEGQSVELHWTTDETVELHLHGYDIEATVKPGASATMSFKAHATGRYPVTSHGFGDSHSHGGGHSEQTLFYVEVHPK